MPLDLTRSLLTVILPGIVLVAPWLLVLLSQSAALQTYYSSYPLPLHIAAFSLAVAAGAILEGWGNYVENGWDKETGKGNEPELACDWVYRDWIAYLRSNCGDNQIVGQRYLSRKVTALYFEMSMRIAIPIGLLGIVALAALARSHWSFLLLLVALAIGAWIWLGKSAKDTHETLCITRWWLFHKSSVKRALPEVVRRKRTAAAKSADLNH